MLKLLKILGRTIGIAFELTLVIVIFLAFLIRTSPVQTFITQKATNYLSNELKTTIQINGITIVFFDEIALEGVFIEDRDKDTIIYAENIYVKIGDYNLAKPSVEITQFTLDNSFIHLSRDESGRYNYQFIRDYFAREKKKKKSSFKLDVDKITLENSRFQYDDNRKERRLTGVDYFHINTSEINGTIVDFGIKNQEYTGKVNSLSFKEKAGFRLENLTTKVKVNSEGIFLWKTKIKSPGSSIHSSKFNMLSTGFTDFLSFVDSVKFDAKIDKSTIDLSEASLFAYALDGMSDTVYLSTELSKRTKNLRLSNFDLRIKNKTQIKGTINIPDFRAPKNGFYHEKLDYIFINLAELKKIRMPKSMSSNYLMLDEKIERLEFVEAKNTKLDGFYSQFVVAADEIKTKIGKVKIDNGIMFSRNEENDSYLFDQSHASEYDVKIEELNLGVLIANQDFGKVDGMFFLSGEAFSLDKIVFNSIEGNVNRFDYLDYGYENITILEGSFKNEVFTGKIDVKDDHLNLAYDGFIDFKGELHMKFEVDIEGAMLNELNMANKTSNLSGRIIIDLIGKNPDKFRGTVGITNLSFFENQRTIKIPSLKLDVTRSLLQDEFNLTSNIVDINIKGKLQARTFYSDFMNQLSKISPAFESHSEIKSDPSKFDHFDYEITVHNADDLLAIFVSELSIASGTYSKGHFYEESSNLMIQIQSDSVSFRHWKFKDVNIDQAIQGENLLTTVLINKINYRDTIGFSDVNFSTKGADKILNSNLTWDQNTPFASSINWESNLFDFDHYYVTLEPSYFTLQEHKWEIVNQSKFSFDHDTIQLSNFLLKRDHQSISMGGLISNNEEHHLNFNFKDIELEEIYSFVSPVALAGKLNAAGYFSNPFRDLHYSGEAVINDFSVRNQLVGDVNVNSEWNRANQSIGLSGDLIYRGNQTFDFIGDYFPKRAKENLDFNLFFDFTDIQFTNAFMDPDVLSDIKGLLSGNLKVTGSPDKPILDGTVELYSGSAKIGVLGTHFGLEGSINADEYGFYIDGIPVFDEEGNAGLMIGSVYHNNFKDFNFDLTFDLEEDGVNKDPIRPWMSIPLDKFLVLNSIYEPGVIYYGQGYATGFVNIFGYTDNLEITVDLETKSGTNIDIPMYGIGEIDEETNFIVFVEKDTLSETAEPKIDFTGVDLDLNFHITPDADVKIIFNEDIGDIIRAHGKGDLSINLNTIGDVTMNGVYTVSDGVYDFAMGILKQKFYIEKGGSISWTGSPYDAFLNLRTYYKVNANIAALTNNQFGSGTGSHQEVLCYLDLKESLMKPSIAFDIAAPNANEASKSLITRIKSDRDELNRQFFSLLLWKKFQPLEGTAAADGSAAINLVTSQINSMLANVSTDYQLNVNMSSDQTTGDNTYEFGVSKGFLNDRLILSGSFGIESQKVEDTKDESFIGDVKLEYLLNESGTFRVDIFNESKEKTVIQSQEQGKFTQGAGLSYKEDFYTFKDFKAVQYFLDIFRKKKNKRYPIKRKRRQVAVPESNRRNSN